MGRLKTWAPPSAVQESPRHVFDRKGMVISTESPRAVATPGPSAVKSRRSLSFGLRSSSKKNVKPPGQSPESGAPAEGTVDLTSRTQMVLFDN